MLQMTTIQMSLVSAAHRVAMHASGCVSRVGRCSVHAVLACSHVVRGADTNMVNQCHTPARDTRGRWGTGVVCHLLVSPSEDESAATVFASLGSAVVSALVFVAEPVNCAV